MTTAVTGEAAPPSSRPWIRSAGLLVLGGALLALIFASITIGSREIGWDDIMAALGGSTDGFDQAAVATRLPRTALAILAGAALAVSGAVLQGVTRNPLADPGILGISMGASLAVVTGVTFFSLVVATSFVWVAIAGAAVTAAFVYAVGSLGRGGATPLKLALAGAATSAALVSFVSAIALPRSNLGEGIQAWMIGGVGGAVFDRIAMVLPFLLVGFAISLLCARGLNSLALGDELASGLGENVAVVRLASFVGAVILCGAVTAVTGPIAFVGLVVPHVCRLIVGVDHRWLLPYSAVGGAILLTAADVLGRIVAGPAEIDVGIITAIIGAPFFIYIVRRQKVSAL